MYGSSALIFVDEIASRLHVSAHTVYRLIHAPGFPVRRCKKLYVIDRNAYLEWERSRG